MIFATLILIAFVILHLQWRVAIANWTAYTHRSFWSWRCRIMGCLRANCSIIFIHWSAVATQSWKINSRFTPTIFKDPNLKENSKVWRCQEENSVNYAFVFQDNKHHDELSKTFGTVGNSQTLRQIEIVAKLFPSVLNVLVRT